MDDKNIDFIAILDEVMATVVGDVDIDDSVINELVDQICTNVMLHQFSHEQRMKYYELMENKQLEEAKKYIFRQIPNFVELVADRLKTELKESVNGTKSNK
jgi:hypothetical protein